MHYDALLKNSSDMQAAENVLLAGYLDTATHTQNDSECAGSAWITAKTSRYFEHKNKTRIYLQHLSSRNCFHSLSNFQFTNISL